MTALKLTLAPTDAQFAANLRALRQAVTQRQPGAPAGLSIHTTDDHRTIPAVSAYIRGRHLFYSNGLGLRSIPLCGVESIEVRW